MTPIRPMRLASLCVLAVLSQAQVCAKHVQFAKYFNTTQHAIILDTRSSTFQPYSCPSAPTVDELGLTFGIGAVPEWLNGTTDQALAPMKMTVESTLLNQTTEITGEFVADRTFTTAGTPYDVYSFTGSIGAGGVNVFFTGDPAGGEMVFISTADCYNEYRNVVLYAGRCPGGHACNEEEFFIPTSSLDDTFEPCEWQLPGCDFQGQIRVCDPDPEIGCDLECPSTAPYFDNNLNQCCSCPEQKG